MSEAEALTLCVAICLVLYLVGAYIHVGRK